MEKIWLKRYPSNVPTEIDPDQYRSLVEILDRSCCQFGRRLAFASMDYGMSYAELEQTSRAFAAWLQHHLGLEKGERVAIMLPNLLQYPVALFGALRIGLVVVNINPLCTPRELEHRLQDSGARVILILANLAHVLAEVIERTEIRVTIVTEVGDLLPYWKAKVVNLVARHIKKIVPSYALPNAVTFKETLSDGTHLNLRRVVVTGEDLAFLQYTDGTTGLSKGVMLTHRNMLANVRQITAWVGAVVREGREVVITALPMYHLFCLTVNCLCFLHLGGLNVLVANPRDPSLLMREMRQWKFSVITGADTLYGLLIDNDKFSTLDFTSLRLAVGVGVAVRRSVAEHWRALTGIPILEGYGLTEASPVICANPVDIEDFSGNVGLPVPSTEVRLCDEEGREVPLGERGELYVRGPQVMRGYWRNPEETARILQEGWLLTGDIATVNERGFFRIVGRKKDLIAVSDNDVFPSEIEELVVACPGVLEAICVGVPDEKNGKAVKLFVVPKPGVELTVEKILAYCGQHLTAYGLPCHIEFRDSLPKSSAGKIIRHALR
ncbi:MAG: AMP-binding protein [Phycisphaerales bacterium]|nr:AMP-binding protein [Phycisphaerales bacterium]